MSEDQHTEWKSVWRDDYLKWLCGFANAQGGVLEIGRNDKGQVVGVDDAERLMEELPNKLRDLLGVYADRLRIWNPRELPESWSEAKLLGPHPSQPFNPDVANAFIRAGEIEALGRGIQRIFEACREAGTPEPRIRVEPRGLWFEFPFSAAYLDSLAVGEWSARVSAQTTPETSGKIVAMIRGNPTITIPEMAETLGTSTRAVEMQIAKLRDAGTIGRIGPARGGHWKVVGGGDE